MKQLDPKAVWLFFISNLTGFGFFGFIIGLWLGSVFFGNLKTLYDLDSVLLPTTGVYQPIPVFDWTTPLIILVLVLTASFLVAKLTYRYYRYEMTDNVFKKEHGIIWKKYVSIPYDRIQNVDIYRGVFARLLGLSDLQIQTAGGITVGSYGAYSEGRLIGISKADAEKLRDELLQRSRGSRDTRGL